MPPIKERRHFDVEHLLERAMGSRRQQGQSIDDRLPVRLSPWGWEHINLISDYAWQANQGVAKGSIKS